ncbi:MAG: nucleoside:proton symporter [Alphaproteobacteria bacterium]|nr:nucleoside:proton symporter [Alphaproteobacteria bacterium]MBM3731914.1 nucleoside:proton symporter [Acidimicrobiia bacterium]
MNWLALQSLGGIAALVAIAFALSEKRSAVSGRLVAGGLALQFALALLLLKVPLVKDALLLLNDALLALQRATQAGTSFVFGYLGGGPLPFAETYAGASFVLAFQALPLVLVMSALSALLFHWRVLPAIVKAFAWVLRRAMGVGGAEGLSAAANVFVGMVEAPLLIRPYLERLSRAELFSVMTCGMATIAGTVMALYASFLAAAVPGALGHILVASLLAAPAAIVVARVMVPADAAERPGTAEETLPPSDHQGAWEAITRGTLDGAQLLINIVAMLIVLVALVSLVNQALGLLPEWGGAKVTLERIFGLALAPLALAVGVPWEEALAAGRLFGIKTVLNELLAYLELAKYTDADLGPRSRLIMTYALCGFANFGSLGIMIGGLATIAPGRRAEIVALGPKTIVSGTLATCLAGAMAGLLW